MSATMARPAAKDAVAREPRVQLLPPSVRERERSRASMRLGVMIVVLGLVAAAGLVAFGYLRQLSSQDALAAANNRTTELFAERAQYAEATQVASTIDKILETRIAMTSYEIDLAELLGMLRSRLAPGMAIQQMEFAVQEPWGVPLTGEDVLAPPRVAVIDLTISSASIGEATTYRDALASIPGYASAVLRTTTVGTDGGVTTQLTLALATEALSGRFLDDADGAADDAAGESSDDENVEG